MEEKKDTEKRGERERSTGYRRFNLRAMGPVTIWDSEDTGGGNRLPWDRSFSSSFLPALPSHPPHRVRVANARIYTWRLLRRCTLVWMEAGHSTAPRTVKRKIYGFRRNSRRSIFEGEPRERRGRKGATGEKKDARAGARDTKKGEMDSLYFGGRHPFLDIHNCTLRDRRRFSWLMMQFFGRLDARVLGVLSINIVR